VNLRLGALFVILERWGDNESFVKKCQELALHDPSQIVRGVAFYVIARLFADQPLTDLVKTFRDRHRVKDISQLKNIASSWLDAIQEVRDRVDCGHARWQQLGTVFLYLPETYPGMTQESRQAAQQFLTDPDPRLRRAGIQLLRGKFGAGWRRRPSDSGKRWSCGQIMWPPVPAWASPWPACGSYPKRWPNCAKPCACGPISPKGITTGAWPWPNWAISKRRSLACGKP